MNGPGRFVFPILFFIALGAALMLWFGPRREAPVGVVGGTPDPGEGRRTALVLAAERVGPSVVSISAIRSSEGMSASSRLEDVFHREIFRRFAPFARTETPPRLGSGIVIDERGYILTNDHLVGGAQEIWVTTPEGHQFRAELVGTDPSYDLAVIRVVDPDSDAFPPAPLGDSEDLMVGEWAVALGNPYGHLLDDPKPSVTAGVISALHRDIDVDGGSAIYKDMIQTDASINPGNSGGPLINAAGQVVGINTFVFTSRGVSLGLGFALPINTALELAQELIRYGRVRGAWVGIAVRNLDDLPVYVLDLLGVRDQRGVVVWTLETGSPSEKAGIRLGDIVRAVNDERIDDAQDARRAIFGARAGDTIRFRVVRDGDTLDIPVTLEPIPGDRSSEREVP